MAEISGFAELDLKLLTLSKKKGEEAKCSAVVDFAQNYAVYVHEDLSAAHAPGKQAKYLEAPARRLKSELKRIIAIVYKQTGSMRKAIIMAALRILRESQKIVPVDTGALRASGYAAMQEDAQRERIKAYVNSEGIRRTAMAARGNKPRSLKSIQKEASSMRKKLKKWRGGRKRSR